MKKLRFQEKNKGSNVGSSHWITTLHQSFSRCADTSGDVSERADGSVTYCDPGVGEDVLCSVPSLSVDLQHLPNQLLQPQQQQQELKIHLAQQQRAKPLPPFVALMTSHFEGNGSGKQQDCYRSAVRERTLKMWLNTESKSSVAL